MKVLVLGRSGQVGRALTGALAGHDVVQLDRSDVDFLQPGRVAHAIAEHMPTIVVNAVAYTAVDKAESEPQLAKRVNADAVSEMAAAADKVGAWVFHYSTDYVFDGTKETPYDEEDTPAPLGVYGHSKLQGERALAAHCPTHLIFRTSWVHSPTGLCFPARILELARDRDSLNIVVDQIGTPTSADLIARVTRDAIIKVGRTQMTPGTYHLAAGGTTNWFEYAKLVVTQAIERGAKLRITPAAITPITSAAYPTAARRPANSRLSTSKLVAALGEELPDWHEGVRETLAQLQARGAL